MAQGLPDSFKPIESDNNELPASFKPIATPAQVEQGPPPEQPSMLSRGWHALTDPLTDAPTRFAKSISDYITDPNQAIMQETGQGGFHDYAANTLAKARGFIGGATEGLGNIASSMTSPLSIGTLGLAGTEVAAGKAGLPQVARIANIGQKIAGVPMVAHGASNVVSPESTLGERAMGVAEMAGGGAAMFHSPSAITEKTPITEGKIETGPIDKYAKLRDVPVGTKYRVSPSEKLPLTIKEAQALGFEFQGIDEGGKILIQKTKESPAVQTVEPEKANSMGTDIINLPRTMMATLDTSAPLRQGLGLIHKKAFWNSLVPMMKAFGKEEFYNQSMDSIAAKPLFRRSVGAGGEIIPSFAEKSGLKLTNMLNNREESMMSGLLDKVPGFSGSERAYTLFLNKLRADTFEQMVNDFGVFSGEKGNLPVASQIAEFINNASGRGSLKATIGGKELSLEKSANALSSVLFSPRLIASRLQMMGRGGRAIFDPQVYLSSAPNIRREYLKSLFAIAATAGTFSQIARLGGATVESDPASADFGKVKFGNTRIDPYGGFQQYIVLAQRLMPQLDLSSMGLEEIGGKMKSTMSGREYNLGDSGFGRSTRADVLGKFVRSKTNPLINFAWGMFAGMKEAGGKSMDLTTLNPYDNAVAQRFLPMFTQDVYELINDETTGPAEKSLAGFLASMGAGVQTYGDERQR